MRMLWVLGLVALVACETEEETTYTQFNSADDTLEVEITAETSLGDAVSVELTSSTGATVVGSASVDPGSGPVGTDHTVTILVDDEYEEEIDRVTARTESPDRGIDEYDLYQDSADHGLWQIELTSAGAEGEERTDTITVRLWVEDEDGVVVDTGDTA